jgi:hypothetical protein
MLKAYTDPYQIYVYIYVCVYIYVYIYISQLWKLANIRQYLTLGLVWSTCIYMYMYIHINNNNPKLKIAKHMKTYSTVFSCIPWFWVFDHIITGNDLKLDLYIYISIYILVFTYILYVYKCIHIIVKSVMSYFPLFYMYMLKRNVFDSQFS